MIGRILMQDIQLQDRAELIIKACLQENSSDVTELFRHIASRDFVRIHGPEHHILDGAIILTAFKNAGGNIDLAKCLEEMAARGLKMPGAICAKWGICGAVSSVGAALSIIDGTQPLSTDDSWGGHMELTSKSLSDIGKLGGPRCCKRDAYISLNNGVVFINKHYGIPVEGRFTSCRYSMKNPQCKKGFCPFFSSN